jgi:hypothetical protein
MAMVTTTLVSTERGRFSGPVMLGTNDAASITAEHRALTALASAVMNVPVEQLTVVAVDAFVAEVKAARSVEARQAQTEDDGA